MTLQSSGAISLANIQTEFGGSNPISLSEYYGAASGVPTSGTISLSDFYGKSACTTFSSGTTYQQEYLAPASRGTSTSTWQTITTKYVSSGACSGSALSSRLYQQCVPIFEGCACTYTRAVHQGTVYQNYGQCSSSNWSGYVTRSGLDPGEYVRFDAYSYNSIVGAQTPICGWEIRTGTSGSLFT